MLEIPDDLLAALGTPCQELSRSVFEAVVLEAYRERKLSTAQLRAAVGNPGQGERDSGMIPNGVQG